MTTDPAGTGRPRGRPGGAATVRRHAVAGPAHRPAAHRRQASGPALHDRGRPAVPDVRVLRLDHRGGLWIGTTAGVARLVGDRLVSRTSVRDADFEGMFVTALLEDREGSIWVATRHGGLHQLRAVPFPAITRREGLAHDDVLSVYEDHAGEPLGRHRRRRPDPLNGGKTITWTIDEGLPSNVIWTLAETRDGAIWVGTASGLARILGGRVTSFAGGRGLSARRHPRHPRGSQRQPVDRQPAGPAAPPRRRGQALHHGERGAVVEQHHGESARPDGTLWIGTLEGGLNRLSDGAFTRYTTDAGAVEQRRVGHPLPGPARLGRHARRQPAPGAQRSRARPAAARRRLEPATSSRSSTTTAARCG